MERIIITEEDLTTNITSVDSTDVVYVPGFSTAIPGTISGSYIVPEAFEPTLCTSVAQFEALFGANPPTFPEAQNYPAYSESTTKGFDSASIPDITTGKENNWFDENDPDPSYIYAKELLLSGLPVIYERVNDTEIKTDSITIKKENETIVKTYSLSSTPVSDLTVVLVEGQTRTSVPSTDYTVSVTEKTITFNDTVAEKTLAENQKFEVTYDIVSTIGVEKMYEALSNHVFKASTDSTTASDDVGKIYDKDYQVKYITCGGYPSLGYKASSVSDTIVKQMALLAETRGDCIALIDHTNNPDRPLIGQTSSNWQSVYTYVNQEVRILSETDNIDTYAAMITPWANYSLMGSYSWSVGQGTSAKDVSASDEDLPGSFAYLTCLAKSLKSNPNWYAIAGASRGLVPNLNYLRTTKLLTNAIANNYQPEKGVCINGITNIKPYGYCIWGNRTMRDQAEVRSGYAIGFLNLRNLICDVKKQAHLAAQSLMFEQNTDVLWINFKSLLTPLLDRMVSGSGLSGYKIVKVESDSKTKLKALIKIYPIYAVEQFEIAIQITDEEVTVE